MEEEVIIAGVAAAPIIAALVSAVKSWVQPKFYPILAILLGILWNVGLTLGTDEFSRATVFLGVVTGLAASGLYSGGKTILESKVPTPPDEGGEGTPSQ